MTDEPPENDPHFAGLFEAHVALDPLARAIREVVSFDVPEDVAARFHALGEQMRLDEPAPCLRRLTIEGGADRDWLVPFREAVLGHVRSGLSAAYYHLSELAALEHAVLVASAEHAPSGDPPTPNGLTMSPGDTSKLDFEYQAFKLALRRTLEYLGIAISRAFQFKDTKFAKIDGALATTEPVQMREAVRAAISDAKGSLDDILGQPTVRDRIAHEEPVQAGAINIHWFPGTLHVGLLGGGDELAPEITLNAGSEAGGARTVTLRHSLAPRLKDQADRTAASVFAVLKALGLQT